MLSGFFKAADGGVYEGSKVEWGLGLGEVCEIEYYIVWFTHCLVHLMLLNTDSSTLCSYRFWG